MLLAPSALRALSVASAFALALSACNGATPASLCDRVDSYNRRCNNGVLSECQLVDSHNQCLASASLYRAEYVAGINGCLDSAACGDAGPTEPSACQASALNAAVSSSGWQSFAHTVCNACPSVLGDMAATADTCFAMLTATATVDGGRVQATLAEVGAIINDASLAPLRSCLQMITSSGAAACAAVQTCQMNNPVTTTSTTDAGSACTTTGGDE